MVNALFTNIARDGEPNCVCLPHRMVRCSRRTCVLFPCGNVHTGTLGRCGGPSADREYIDPDQSCCHGSSELMIYQYVAVLYIFLLFTNVMDVSHGIHSESLLNLGTLNGRC